MSSSSSDADVRRRIAQIEARHALELAQLKAQLTSANPGTTTRPVTPTKHPHPSPPSTPRKPATKSKTKAKNNPSPDNSPIKRDPYQSGGSTEGLKEYVDDRHHTDRRETRRLLLDLSQKKGVVLVRGPFAVGKTSLVQLFGKEDDVTKGLKVQRMSMLLAPNMKDADFEDKWKQFWYENTRYTGVPGWPWSRKKERRLTKDCPVVGRRGDLSVNETLSRVDLLVIDEIQVIYPYGPEHPFWKAMKHRKQANPTASVLLFGVYGYSRSNNADQQAAGTPIDFGADCEVGLSHLRYTDEEASDVLQKWHAHYNHGFDAETWTFTCGILLVLTNKHPGLLQMCLRELIVTFVEQRCVPSKDAVEKLFLSHAFFLKVHNANRSHSRALMAFPAPNTGSPQARDLLKKLVFRSAMEALTNTEPGATQLIRRGLVTSDEKGLLDFACPLVKHVLRTSYARQYGDHTGSTMEPNQDNFEGIMKLALCLMDIDSLKGGKMANEAACAALFYEALHRVLPKNVQPAVEVTDLIGVQGRPDMVLEVVDAHLDKTIAYYGVEFLHKSRKLKEHAKRFQPGGIYSKFNWTGSLVIDFTHVKRPKKLWAGTWRVNLSPKHLSLVDDQGRTEVLLRIGGLNNRTISLTASTNWLIEEKERLEAKRKVLFRAGDTGGGGKRQRVRRQE